MRDELVSVTGGNPLALLELPAALTDDELAGRAPLRLDLPLNERIERAFMAAGGAARATTRGAMLLLAAADDSGDVGTLLRAAEGVGVGPSALDAVERAGLLAAEGPRLRFRHPLAALGRLPAPPASPSAARRTRPWPPRSTTTPTPTAARGTVPPPPRPRTTRRPRRWPCTADHAASRGGHTAAARALERAAELDSDPQRRARRLVAAARSSALAGRVGHAVALLDRAEPELRDPMARGVAMRVRGMASMAIGRPATRTRCSPTPPARAAGGPPGRARAADARLHGRGGRRRPGRHPQHARRAGHRAAHRRRALPEPADERHQPAHRGRRRAGVASIEEALALADDLEVVEQVQQAGGGAVFLGDWTRARRYFDRAIVLARDRGAIALLPETLGLAR